MSPDKSKIKKRKSKKLNKIAFEAETVTKDIAEQTLQLNESLDCLTPSSKKEKESSSKNVHIKPKKRKAENKEKSNSVSDSNIEHTNEQVFTQTTKENSVKPETQKGESKRAKKRKKHEQLVLAKKVQVDSETREKCLNYLSKWKHNRDEWKFEKLRQVWLQQSMFDSEKMPDKFWNTLLEYLENSKGNIRQKIIDEALKLIEQEEKNESVEDLNNKTVKLKRARDVIQYLQT